ncbi:hypothetical protein GCM10027343_13510 [Noviherbaspirillum agri]
MTNEDGLHQRIARLGAGDHVSDLLVDPLDWNTCVHRRLCERRISIEHISAGDVIATGVVHFDDGHVRITADLPKKVDWDQKRLSEITQRIAANGDDPSEYVEISYRISETKFNAWPESIKSAFAPARTLKTGKPGFRLALLQE